jgi:hypothetical protein
MANQWTSTEIARLENRRFIWRDAKLVVLPLAPVWVALAVLGLAAGLSWRLLDGASPPDLYALLDVCGLALWLAGWRVAAGVAAAMRRRSLHLLNDEESLSRLLFVGFALGGAALALSLAPAGLLLAYSTRTILQTLSTQDIAQLNVNIGALWVGTVLVGGTLCVLGSCFAALSVQRLGRLAPLIWLVVSCLMQLSTLAGLSDHIRRIEPGGERVFSWIPPTLGVMARSTMANLADPGIRYEYANPLADTSIVGALLGIVVLVAASLWVGTKLHATAFQPGSLPLAAVGAIATVGIYVVGQLWVFVSTAAVSSPGNWATVVALGPLACVVLYWLWSGPQVPLKRSDFIWLFSVAIAAIAFTAPQIRAGQGNQPLVLWSALLLLGPYLLTMDLLRAQSQPGQSITRAWPLVAFTLLLLPLPGRFSVLDMVREWALQGANKYVAAGIATLMLLAVINRHLGPHRTARRQARDLRPAA